MAIMQAIPSSSTVSGAASAPLIRAVTAAVPELAGRAWKVLPGGRVNRLWRVADHVVKLYDPEGASPLFPNDPAAEAKALCFVAQSGLGPRLLATGPNWLVYAHVPGDQWAGDPVLVAQTMARLHALPAPPPDFRKAAIGSAAILAQAAAILATCRGHLSFAPQDPGIGSGPTSLIHGDAVAGNMIQSGGSITLIDWQCPALGDPAEDLATFLSPAMQWLYRGQQLDIEQKNEFLAACPKAHADRYLALAPVFHWRMAAHCLWRAERGAADYATALKLELAALEPH